MRRIVFISNLLLLTGLAIAQEYNTFNKDAELRKFTEQGGKVEEISQGIYDLTNRLGERRIFNFNPLPKTVDELPLTNSIIINVGNIDTSKYSGRFRFWQKINIVNDYESIVPAEDLNNNGLLELYGFNEISSVYAGPVVIYEQNNQGIFHKVYTYDSNTVFVQGIGDVDSDGNKEIHLRTLDTLNGNFYKADTLNSLPTTFDFTFYYYPYPGQIDDLTFGYLDKNKMNDCVFISSYGHALPAIIIGEYKDSLNNFTSVYEQITADTNWVNVPSGFAIGDFDEDARIEIISGTTQGIIYSIEAVKENQYNLVWQGTAPTYNAYMITSTDDIDKNRKPEFWVGGQDFSTGISTFQCYESDGDNSYIPVAEIQLRYLVTLGANYLQSADIDNDSTEELIISLGNYLIILKFTGKPGQHQFEITYAKINETTQPGAQFHPATIKDFNKDGKKDILLPMEKYVNPNIDLFSYLLKQDSVTYVKNENAQEPGKFELMQNYPNPFNPTTMVKFRLGIQSRVIITIYNLLGKEIKILVDEMLSAGEYSYNWDGKDNEGNYLPGGVYFIQMKTQYFKKTIKTVLLK